MITPARALLLVVVALLAGCSKPNELKLPPPPEVTVVLPVTRTVTEYLEFSGMTQPLESVEIRARVRGFLKERHFEEGAEVKKGQLLLVIDEETFQIQLDSAQTSLNEAEAALQQAVASKAREVARANVNLSDSQLDLAQQEEARVSRLYKQKVATEAEMDQVSATRKSREAELESAKANLEQAMAVYDTSILSARAKVASARIAVRNAALDLSYCRMEAPIDGRISRVNVDIGNLVGDGEASVLATIVRMDPIYAYATISESDVLRTPSMIHLSGPTKDGKPREPVAVELGLASQEGFPYAGQINYSDPSLDSGTGTLRTRGVFDNADRSLLPGMFVRMRVPVTQRTDAMLVPERALGTDQSGQYVLVVNAEGKVEYRPVKIGVSIEGLRVIEGPVAIGDKVIVEGLLRARPGSTVVPKLDDKPTQAAATAEISGRL